MSCPECEHIVERPDLPHTIRSCKSCGRELRIHEAGEHGIGFKINKGDQVVIPDDWLKISLNPLKSRGQFTKAGLLWFAELVNIDDLPSKKDSIVSEIDRLEARCNQILSTSLLLRDFDLNNELHAERVIETLRANRDKAEWWAFLMGTFICVLRDALKNSDTLQAVWAMGCIERCRSMLVFKEHLEEVVWMGHSAKKRIDILQRWDTNKKTPTKASGKSHF